MDIISCCNSMDLSFAAGVVTHAGYAKIHQATHLAATMAGPRPTCPPPSLSTAGYEKKRLHARFGAEKETRNIYQRGAFGTLGVVHKLRFPAAPRAFCRLLLAEALLLRLPADLGSLREATLRCIVRCCSRCCCRARRSGTAVFPASYSIRSMFSHDRN